MRSETCAFVVVPRETVRMIFYLSALAAQQAELRRLPVNLLSPSESFDRGGGGSRDLGSIT